MPLQILTDDETTKPKIVKPRTRKPKPLESFEPEPGENEIDELIDDSRNAVNIVPERSFEQAAPPPPEPKPAPQRMKRVFKREEYLEPIDEPQPAPQPAPQPVFFAQPADDDDADDDNYSSFSDEPALDEPTERFHRALEMLQQASEVGTMRVERLFEFAKDGKTNSTAKRGFCGKLDFTEDFHSDIQKLFGRGDYLVTVFANGKIYTKQTVHIDADAPAAPQHSTRSNLQYTPDGTPIIINSDTNADAQLEKMLSFTEKLLKVSNRAPAALEAAPPRDVFDDLERVEKLIKRITPAPAPKTEPNFLEQIGQRLLDSKIEEMTNPAQPETVVSADAPAWVQALSTTVTNLMPSLASAVPQFLENQKLAIQANRETAKYSIIQRKQEIELKQLEIERLRLIQNAPAGIAQENGDNYSDSPEPEGMQNQQNAAPPASQTLFEELIASLQNNGDVDEFSERVKTIVAENESDGELKYYVNLFKDSPSTLLIAQLSSVAPTIAGLEHAKAWLESLQTKLKEG